MTQRENVIKHVSQMIVTLGVKSVRMDDVASSMAMSKRTLYEMFGDKEELLYESLAFLINERGARLTNLTRNCDNMLEVLLLSVRELCGNGIGSELELRLAYNLKKFYPSVYDRVRKYHSEHGLKGLRFALDKCNSEGLLDPHADIELMAQLFLMTVGMYMSDGNVTLPKHVSREEAFAAMTINFLRGIASVKGLQVIDQTLARDAKSCCKELFDENRQK